MKARYKTKIIIVYLTIIIFTCCIMMLSISNTSKLEADNKIVINNIMPVKLSTSNILTALIDEETGVRGYIISRNTSFLESYYQGAAKIKEQSKVFDNKKNIEIFKIDYNSQIKALLDEMADYFEEQISLVKNGEVAEAQANLNKGKVLVDYFRKIQIAIDTHTNLICNNIQKKIDNSQLFEHAALIFTAVAFTLLTLLLIKILSNNLLTEIQSKDEINNQLERLLRLQEEFTANISHELKTPLNVIFSTIQLFDYYHKNNIMESNSENIGKYIKTVKQNCYRLLKLINNIMDLSKIESGFYKIQLSNHNIVEIVEDIVMSVAEYIESKGLNIIFDTDVEELIIACDPEKVERIILNLISNAIKFSNLGGTIFVNIENHQGKVYIRVRDEGIGIDQNKLSLIFDRFKQADMSLKRNAEGSGVGLYLVKYLVEMSGGAISVKSAIGRGSEFTIELPVRTVSQESFSQKDFTNTNVEKINIEFSDIYT